MSSLSEDRGGGQAQRCFADVFNSVVSASTKITPAACDAARRPTRLAQLRAVIACPARVRWLCERERSKAQRTGAQRRSMLEELLFSLHPLCQTPDAPTRCIST